MRAEDRSLSLPGATTSTPRVSTWLPLILLGPVLLAFAPSLVSPAWAAASTKDVAREAKAACAAGDVDRGIRLLATLYADTNDINWVYNQGRCYQQNERPEEAIGRFEEYLRRSSTATAAERTEVEGFIADLKTKQATKIAVEPNSVAPAIRPPAPSLPFPPATSEVGASAGPGSSQDGSPTLATLAPAPTPPGSHRRKILTIAAASLGGLAVVSVVGGIVFQKHENAAQRDFDMLEKERGHVPGAIGEADWGDAQSRGDRAATLRTVSFVVAAVALVGAGTSVFLARRPESTGYAGTGHSSPKVSLVPIVTSGGVVGRLDLVF
jgi:hypothetical protein